jgi:Presenilin
MLFELLQAIEKWQLPVDTITYYGVTWNFAAVGVVAIFYQKGIPTYSTQGYLVSVFFLTIAVQQQIAASHHGVRISYTQFEYTIECCYLACFKHCIRHALASLIHSKQC